MSRPVEDYVALAMIANLDDEETFSFSNSRQFSGSLEEIKEIVEKKLGFSISQDLLNSAIRTLAECNLVRVTDDQYSGTFIKIYGDRFGEFVDQASKESSAALDSGAFMEPDVMRADYRSAYAMEKHGLFEDYQELGDDWAKRAIQGLRDHVEREGSPENLKPASPSEADVPASDRIVTLEHNQQAEIEEPLENIVELVEVENSIDGQDGLRELVLGQLRAGRELIRAGVFSVHSLQMTLVVGLRMLVDKYGDTAIAIAAAKLLDLLLKHYGIGQ